MNDLTNLHTNILGGIGLALFAVLVGTKMTRVGFRDYLLIVVLAVLGTASAIEHWFLESAFSTACLVGFSVGFLADDVYMNVKATVPDFIKEMVGDVMNGIKQRVKALFGSRDPWDDVNDEEDDDEK